MNNPLFSILVANYNNGHFFKDCYASILNQTYTNWEVIIVDDGSTDDSIEVIKQIVGDDKRFKLFVNEENKGCGYTKNRCAKLAQGEVLGFLDPDDALTATALAIMSEAHYLNREAAIITSKYELVDLQMNFIQTGSHGECIPENKSYLTYGYGAMTHFATFKKDKFELTEGINKKMKRAVDQDLYYKMEEVGNHLFLDRILYQYRIHSNSISANENKYKAEYWHFYAMLKAYNRRVKLNLLIDNLSKIQIKKMKSNYFISRFKMARDKKKICTQYFFLLKSIIVFPRYNIRYKIKSLIGNYE